MDAYHLYLSSRYHFYDNKHVFNSIHYKLSQKLIINKACFWNPCLSKMINQLDIRKTNPVVTQLLFENAA